MDQTATSSDFNHKVHECQKVCKSFEYYIENYCWIEDKVSSQAVRFKLWPAQKAILPKIMFSMLLFILKARQLGLTWMCAAYALWLCITKPLQLVVVISAKEEWAVEFLERVKFIMHRLPDWMRPPLLKETSQHLVFQHQDGFVSEIKSLATTEEGAQSKTPTLLILDETARNRYIKDIWASSKPGIDAAKGRIIGISNSIKNGVGWPFTRDLVTKGMRGENNFDIIFLPWSARPDRPTNFKELQLLDGMDEDDFSQHYPETLEEAISVLGGSYFGKALAKYRPYPGEVGIIQKSDTGYIFVPEKGGIVEIWDKPQAGWNHRYAIGADVSEGLGETSSVAYVYDRVDNRYVARMRSNRIDAYTWGDKLVELGHYYLGAYIGPERTGAGITTVMRLQALRYPYLYYRQRPGTMKGEYTTEYGWPETNEQKQILADELRRNLNNVFSQVPCAILIDECSTFIRHENGRLAHEEGKYDDCVIAAGIALQVSQFMPATVELRPKKRPSQYDKRLEELARGDVDDHELVSLAEHEANMRRLGYTTHDVNGLIEDRGGRAIPTITEASEWN